MEFEKYSKCKDSNFCKNFSSFWIAKNGFSFLKNNHFDRNKKMHFNIAKNFFKRKKQFEKIRNKQNYRKKILKKRENYGLIN